MPVYSSSDQLYSALKMLFTRVGQTDLNAARTLAKSRLNLRMRTLAPVTEVCLNGRQTSLQIVYGPSSLRADIELELPADLLHRILLNEISMRKAYSGGKIKLRGPIWKAFVFDDIFRASQKVYPEVLKAHNIEGGGG